MEYQDTPADPADYLPPQIPQPYCIACGKTPEEIAEYQIAAIEEAELGGAAITPTQYVLREEGTLNPANGHFLCTEDYINAGQPSGRDGRGGPGRWVAP